MLGRLSGHTEGNVMLGVNTLGFAWSPQATGDSSTTEQNQNNFSHIKEMKGKSLLLRVARQKGPVEHGMLQTSSGRRSRFPQAGSHGSSAKGSTAQLPPGQQQGQLWGQCQVMGSLSASTASRSAACLSPE